MEWNKPRQSRRSILRARTETELVLHSSLQRGWFFGLQEFREKLLVLAAKTMAGRLKRKADGYPWADIRDHGEWRAQRILEAGLGLSKMSWEGAAS